MSNPLQNFTPEGPDYRQGYLRVPLSLWRALYCEAPLTRRQLQIVSVVIRESWGWRSSASGVKLWTRPLTTAQIAHLTRLSTDRLARDLRQLQDRGILLGRDGHYQFVPHPERWSYPHPREPRASNRRSLPPKPPESAVEKTPSKDVDRNDKDNLKKRSKSGEAELSPFRSLSPQTDVPPANASTL